MAAAFAPGYVANAPNGSLPYNVGAKPYFGGLARAGIRPENFIRNTVPSCCGDLRPPTGNDVPAHWHDGGHGWVTRHFVDIEAFDWEQKRPGVHRCALANGQGNQCEFIAEGEESSCCCWRPRGRAPRKMEAHLKQVHGMQEPPRREWATGLCVCGEGLCDACFCSPCQGSRQIMAGHGHKETMSWLWCCALMCMNGNEEGEGGGHSIVYAAWLSRFTIKRLHNIDEGCCKTMLAACCCPHFSLAQTYREFSAAGVWPGGVCEKQPLSQPDMV